MGDVGFAASDPKTIVATSAKVFRKVAIESGRYDTVRFVGDDLKAGSMFGHGSVAYYLRR